MPSAAAIKYKALAARALIILKADRKGLSRQDVQALYGGAFVAQVASWNAYIAALVPCFFQETSNPADSKFHAMHALADMVAKLHLERFNTPNAENTRTLLLTAIGYDPWPDWQWPIRHMNGLSVRNRLNEILKVRHSLAHGFTMPGFSWTQAASGEIRLTVSELAWSRSFLNHLVSITDLGVKNHIVRLYGHTPSW
jgi:hypothetical protein